MQQNCLNCSRETHENFCSNCGQKTDTHPIRLKTFLFHDLLHGVWHLDRGILFTLKEAFVRPGQAALDYISGKRIRYYNVFYLSLLLIGLNLLLLHFYDNIRYVAPKEEAKELSDFMNKYAKFALLAFIPLFAANAMLVFRRLKLNIAEHFIISGMCLLGILVLMPIFTFLRFISYFDVAESLIKALKLAMAILILLFPMWTYYNAVKGKYTAADFIWRILVFVALILLEYIIILYTILFFINSPLVD